jgi:protein-S-isoprenylcysteine O-methyltransferase Ste14
MSDVNDQTRRSALDNRIPPPLVFLVTTVAMLGAAAFLPRSDLATPWNWALGAILMLIAGLVGPPAIWRFRKAGTMVNPVAIEKASVLVTGGVYRWSRNPMYLAMVALLGAVVAFTAQPWLILGVVVFVLFITRFQIIPEERAMRKRFGAAYQAYCSEVRRWL